MAIAESPSRSVVVGALCLLLGILGTLVVTWPTPRPPEVVVCPPVPPCEACPPCPPPVGGKGAAHPPPPPHVPARQPSIAPLPAEPADPDLHRERLRTWFQGQASQLASCFSQADPRRRVLVEMTLEADGTVTGASLLGATDLPRPIADCLVAGIKAMKAPREELRGRETLVVHVSL